VSDDVQPEVVIVSGEIVELVHDCNALCGDGVRRNLLQRRMVIPDAGRWTVSGSPERPTVDPSILCEACGLHGHWREGKWVNC